MKTIPGTSKFCRLHRVCLWFTFTTLPVEFLWFVSELPWFVQLQELKLYRASCRTHECAFQDVFKFSDVSRPVICKQPVQGPFLDFRNALYLFDIAQFR